MQEQNPQPKLGSEQIKYLIAFIIALALGPIGIIGIIIWAYLKRDELRNKFQVQRKSIFDNVSKAKPDKRVYHEPPIELSSSSTKSVFYSDFPNRIRDAIFMIAMICLIITIVIIIILK